MTVGESAGNRSQSWLVPADCALMRWLVFSLSMSRDEGSCRRARKDRKDWRISGCSVRRACPDSKYVRTKVPDVYRGDIGETLLSMNTQTPFIFCSQPGWVVIGAWQMCSDGVIHFLAKRVLMKPLCLLCLKRPGRRWMEWFIGTYMICLQHNLPTGPQWIWGNRGTACAKWHRNSQETRGAFLVCFTVLPEPHVYLMHHFYSGQSSNLISAGPVQLPTLNLWLCMGSKESVCAL